MDLLTLVEIVGLVVCIFTFPEKWLKWLDTKAEQLTRRARERERARIL
ncbi:MAG: hypothetical protein AAB581_00675 [Patescibacteria group bacterium]